MTKLKPGMRVRSTQRQKKRLTYDPNEITCKNCLKIKRLEHWKEHSELYELDGTDL